MEYGKVSLGDHEQIVNTLRYKVEMYRTFCRITHRQYIHAMTLLSNPNFDNLDMYLLNKILNGTPSNT
jgi:hypothetical protein